MPAARDLRAAADRIEALLGDIAQLGDAQVRTKAEELVRLLMELYGGGLARLLEIVDETGGSAADAVFEGLGADPLVASLLLLHGLHPIDLRTRVERALEEVRPYLGSHGGDVKLLGIEQGVVRLRLEGSCNGCPSSTVTMKLAVEQAIEKAAPEIAGIEVEGAEPQPAPSSPLVTLGSASSPGACPAAPAQGISP
jgi:Fe-S cluster biogenesis protein NfuA